MFISYTHFVYVRLCSIMYVFVRLCTFIQGDISKQLLQNYERREEMTTRLLLTDLSEVEMRTDFDVTTLTVHHSKKVIPAFPFSILHKSLVSAHHSFNHCLAPVRVLL